MAFYDSYQNKVIYFEPVPCEEYPGWEKVDCGCSHGLEWGGEEPIECSTCNGNSILYHHIKTGLLTEYPGGRIVGRQ